MDDDGLGEFVFGGKPTPRSQAVARIVFGALGTGLSAAGAVHLWVAGSIPGLPLRVAASGFMLGLASLWLFNVMLAKPWRWPLWCVGLGLPLVFVVRIVFGA